MSGIGFERSTRAVVWTGAVLILIGIAYPAWLGRVWTDTDLGSFHLPMRHFYHEMLATGGSFLWFPYEYSGFYLHGEGQFGLYHPFNLALYRALPFSLAFDLELVRNYVLLLAGTFWLGRRWGLSGAGPAVFAVLFAFSGFNFLHFMHLQLVLIVAHLPFALVAIDAVMRPKRPREFVIGIVGLNALTASQLMLGHPQGTWLCLVAEGLYVLYLLMRGASIRTLPWLLASQVLAAAVAAIAVLPMWQALQASSRGGGDPDFAFSLALHPVNLIQLVSPLFFRDRSFGDAEITEFAVYGGAALPALLAWLFVRRGQLGRATWPARAALLVALFALLMALGGWGGIYRLQTLLPVMGLFRAPARYLLLFHGAIALLMALAVADLAKRLKSQTPAAWPALRPLAAAVLLSLAATGTLVIVVSLWPALSFSAQRAAIGSVWLGPLLILVATALVAATARGHRAALIALLAFVVADHAAFGLSFLWRTDPVDLERYVESARLPGWVDRHRMHYGPFILTMRDVRFAGGYVAIEPKRRLETHLYSIDGEPSPGLTASLRVAGVHLAHGRIVPRPMPRARLVPRAEVIVDLRRQIGEIEIETTALVDAPVSLDPGKPGSAQLQSDRPGDITLSVTSPGRQLLVLSESHHPGWRVTLDGSTVPVVPVYGDFLGCVVPAGRHEVRFRFEPEDVVLGRRLTAIGLLATAMLALAAVSSSRRAARVAGLQASVTRS